MEVQVKKSKISLSRKISFLICILSSISILYFMGSEAYAFSQPIVRKANQTKDHLILIAQAVTGIGFVFFIYTLLISRPNYRLLVCTLLAGVLLGAIGVFLGYVGGA